MTAWRQRVTEAAEGLFSHAPEPLASTFDHPGDPGLFGPGSVTWRVMCDCSTFVGGVRALLVQAAHPEVAAGVGDHSSYRSDPLGRLSRTAAY
ncbi:MAG: oxygenase MpaB family protein, partial [Actinomycetota bacterium]|nr:oxygenase MpaB family protein [Actinomycetota bacterium]MED6329271.1 oxygenase MpaB family protein [Actinomycetota bacterium]